MDILTLQHTYPIFSYDSYEITHFDTTFQCTFHFSVAEHHFSPFVSLSSITDKQIQTLSNDDLDQYVFHLGLAEIPTYWKAFCSNTIEIKAGTLDETQIEFWQKLLCNGLGEFFFVNNIKPFIPEFIVNTTSKTFDVAKKHNDSLPTTNTVLIPVGGGKDSVVTLELLAKAGYTVTTCSAHQGSAKQIIDTFSTRYQLQRDLVFTRTIDPKLLELNQKGHPNGHTPFSSLLAFLTTLTAKLLTIPYIAVSNERSANEATGEYEGMDINHQYSKSFAFERDFQKYVIYTFDNAPTYFSFLRPLYEIQIVQLFTKYPEYFSVFHSCNVGQKTNTWCGMCAKCTFVALMLSAFLDDETVFEIFGANVLSNPANQIFVDELLGKTEYKPFECVGTVDETWSAVYLAYNRRLGKTMPPLLAHYQKEIEERATELEQQSRTILQSYSSEHVVPDQFEKLLTDAIT